MKYIDKKRARDRERHFLKKHGWRAVEAVKTNGAFKNAWIHPSRKGSYSRQEAVSITKRNHNGVFYKLDSDFFGNIDTVSSYWAGFLAADGGVSKSTVAIDLSPVDKQHLEKLRSAISYNGQVQKTKRHARLQFNSGELVECLAFNFGVKPRKSLTLGVPSLRDEENIRAFIRGYFDGDGSLYQRADGNWCISFVGTKRLLTWIKNCLQTHVLSIGNPSVLKDGNVFRLTFAGKQSRVITEWLYKNSKSSTRLTRKYNRYKQMHELSV